MLMQTKGCARIMDVMAPEKKWTDHRLDDLAKKVDEGVTEADTPLDEFRGEVNARFDKVDERFVSLERALLMSAVAVIVTLITCCATLAGIAIL
jgi:hypothetical protein